MATRAEKNTQRGGPAGGDSPPPKRQATGTTPKDKLQAESFKEIYFRGDGENYKSHRYQYAYSSHFKDGYMEPLAIIYPDPKDPDTEVRKAIQYALKAVPPCAIAIRSGGHQYSGASSTFGDNILLDVSDAYLTFEPPTDIDTNHRPLVRVGVGFPLVVLNEKLGELGLFVPHGQCSHVHVGGHAHTGGYGQLGRAFGLFADHIETIEVWTANDVAEKGDEATARVISRDSTIPADRDLFYAVLGGSPGNFGILTHVTLKTRRDVDHPDSRGLKLVSFPYNKDVLHRLLDLKATMASSTEFSGDYDFCITVMDKSDCGKTYLYDTHNMDAEEKTRFEKEFGKDGTIFWPSHILVYVQWANRSGRVGQYNSAFFDQVRRACHQGHLGFVQAIPLVKDNTHKPMSYLTRQWVFMNVREYLKPYHKRTWTTNSTKLSESGWAAFTTDQIHSLKQNKKGCKLVVQIQHFGGTDSAFFKNGQDPKPSTSYSWRDSTVVVVLDAFYDPKTPGSEQLALDWQAKNDQWMVGPTSHFSTTDRRVFWGSYGEFDMDKAWPFYYDSVAKYQRLVQIKQHVDPTRVFSANSFGVGSGPKPTSPVSALAPADGPSGGGGKAPKKKAGGGRADVYEDPAECDETRSDQLLARMEEHADRARRASTL